MARKKREPRGRGRPVDPQSLRRRGAVVRARIPAELLARAQAAAGDEGLSAVIRRLLEQWLAGRGQG